MPNKDSAKKALRKTITRTERNAKIKIGVRKLTKKSLKAITSSDDQAADLVRQTLKALDKAAQKGVIKKNTRDRKKSRLHLKLNASMAK